MSKLQANLLLGLTAAVWGLGFVFQRHGGESFTPFFFNGYRFLIGGLFLLPLLLRKKIAGQVSTISLTGAGGALAAGMLMFCGATLQQTGLAFTSVTNAGFITGLYVVLVPLMSILWGERPGVRLWIAVSLATIGLYFLAGVQQTALNKGDGMMLVGTLFWAGHVHLIGRLTSRHDSLLISVLQFLVCALISFGVGDWYGESWLPVKNIGWLWVALSGALAIGLGFTLQVVAQQWTSSTDAAIILSLESLFAALCGVLFLEEMLSGWGLMGCGLMLLSFVLAQTGSQPQPEVG